MKVMKTLSLLLFTILLFGSTQSQLVYNQMAGQYDFDIGVPQICKQLYLGEDFLSTQQFALWGWIKPSQNVPAISNIVSLTQPIQGQPSQSMLESALEMEENGSQVQGNLGEGCLSQNFLDMITVNYELNENLDTFNIGFTFLGNNGQHLYEAIKDLPNNQEWTFFAVSADFQSGNAIMYVKSTSSQAGDYKQQRFQFPSIQITNADYLMIGGTNERLYKTFTQYIGSVANVQMSRFFTSELDYQWAGYMFNTQLENALFNTRFQVKDNSEQLVGSYGTEQIGLSQAVNQRPLYQINNNQYGVRYFQNAKLPLYPIDFRNQQSNTQGALFFFDILFSKDLKNNFILLTRGYPTQDGFMQIKLVKKDNQRIVRLVLNPDINNEEIVFDSPQTLDNDKRHQFMIGIAQGPNNYLLPVYIDFEGQSKFGPYIQNYPFDFGPLDITMFQPSNSQLVLINEQEQQDRKSDQNNESSETSESVESVESVDSSESLENDNGQNGNANKYSNRYVDLHRMIVFNSLSPAINLKNRFQPNVQGLIQNRLEPFNQQSQCKLSNSYYDDSYCLLCQDGVLSASGQCVPYCQLGSVNRLNGQCVECINEVNELGEVVNVCPDFDFTTYALTPVKDREYLLYPNRQVITPNVDYNNYFTFLTVDPQSGVQTPIENVVVQPLENNQFQVNLPEDVQLNDPLDLYVTQNFVAANPLYDVNRNLVYSRQENIRAAYPFDSALSVVGDENYYYCVDLDNRGLKMRILAYILLLAYAGTAVLLLLWTICCWRRFWDLGGLWKFLLHHWMKLNLVAFFILLAINMPCCVREFLHQLYRFVVSWDHELRHWIDNVNDDDRDYREGFIKRRLPFQFRVEHVLPFILHNLLISFIAQLAIATIYILLKLWDYCNVWKRSCLFRWFVFWEFTALIVGYLLFHMRDFVFSGLNWRKAIFSHSYFICCFLIAIFFALVFWLFWFYSLIVLLTKGLPFWSDITNLNKFYYFFVGYRNDRLARTYDHWVTLAHFVVAMMIGIVIYSPRAQMIVIVSALGVLMIITLIFRPWKSMVLFICDIIAQIAILLTAIFFLVYAIQDNDGRCLDCDDRESAHCWIIVLFLFICLMIGLLGLLLAMLMDCCRRGKQVERTSEHIHHYNQETEVVNRQDHVYVQDRNVYENVDRQNVVMGGAMIGNDRVVNQEVVHTDQVNRNVVNTQHLSSNNVNYNTSVNQVHAVQPDTIDDGSIQHEMLNAMNEKSHVQNTLSRNDVNGQTQYLQGERNQFYNKVNQESNMDLYNVKNLGDNEHVFTDDVRVTKYTKTTHN